MPKKAIRQIRVDGQVAYVPLTQGLEAVIDLQDISCVSGSNWYAFGRGKHKYAARWSFGDEGKKLILMHRHILQPPNEMDVDHADGNGLNNRRSNIRIATRSQNMHNKKMQRNNTSGFKGVHWDRNKKKWQANIKLNDKRHYIGLFNSAEEASEAYRAASEKLHLDFARMA